MSCHRQLLESACAPLTAAGPGIRRRERWHDEVGARGRGPRKRQRTYKLFLSHTNQQHILPTPDGIHARWRRHLPRHLAQRSPTASWSGRRHSISSSRCGTSTLCGCSAGDLRMCKQFVCCSWNQCNYSTQSQTQTRISPNMRPASRSLSFACWAETCFRQFGMDARAFFPEVMEVRQAGLRLRLLEDPGWRPGHAKRFGCRFQVFHIS